MYSNIEILLNIVLRQDHHICNEHQLNDDGIEMVLYSVLMFSSIILKLFKKSI